MNGIPHTMIDGTEAFIGADLCPAQTVAYSEAIDASLAAAGELSPIKITGSLTFDGPNATVSATYELTEPGSYTAHQATLYLVEDDITWCCGYGGVSHWDHVVRMVRSTPVSLTVVGQEVTVEQTINTTGMNVANLHPVAIYEFIGGSEAVLQASDFTSDFSYFHALYFPDKLGSVPAGNGTFFYQGQLLNAGENADVIDLSFATGGFPWTAEVLVEGEAGYVTTASIPLAVGESKDVTIRVTTDGTLQQAAFQFLAESQATAEVKQASFRLFNGSPAILLVDDDVNQSAETAFTSALPALGYLYDVAVGTVSAAGMIGYDAIIWQSGFVGNVLSTTEKAGLEAYLDQDGRLFLATMDLLTGQGTGNSFTQNYLGIASFTNNTLASVATGVGGDPITNGMVHSLTWVPPSSNRVDRLVPGANAATILTSEIGPNNPAAVRHEAPGGFRVVTSTINQVAFSTVAADPNNNETFIEKVLDWLLEPPATDAPDEVLAAKVSGLIGASPNPFSRGAELRFAVSPNAANAPVSLVVVDASGRQVRQLVGGSLPTGRHFVAWDGLDDAGRTTANGMYFAVLKTVEGESSSKVVRLQ